MKLSELEEWTRQLGGDIDTGIARKMGRTATAIHLNLRNTTPVDIGRAKNGWIVSLDFRPLDIPPKGAFSQPINLEAKLRTSRAGSTRRIYIVNNVPYIGLLNAGSSRQAPAGFVEVAILRGMRETRGVSALEVSRVGPAD